MTKTTKAFTPENMAIIADLRNRKIPNAEIAKILGVSPSALARNVRKNGFPRQQKKTMGCAKSALVPTALQADAETLRTDPITGARVISCVPTPRNVGEEATRACKEEQRWKNPRMRDRAEDPFRFKARVAEMNRDRRAIIQEIEGEIDRVFRKFCNLAGPNTRIQDPVNYSHLSPEARAALDDLQALVDAARHLRSANGPIVEASIQLHNAGAARTRQTA